MLNAFENICKTLGYLNAHVERFAAVPVTAPLIQESYTVELRKSGKSVQVSTGASILDALLDAGVTPDYSCKEGICGACETKVLSGEVEHHDSILSTAEWAANKSMMICVSRCRKGPLVLDL